MKTVWDYTERAATYDMRADYSYEAITEVINRFDLCESDLIADIGAGTGKLTKLLLKSHDHIYAVEPNERMRNIGMKNVTNPNVTWREGIGERTGLESDTFKATFFGSSFNVVNQKQALGEVQRILKPQGWFCCMWNHRDILDPVQASIEKLILNRIPDYDYGTRRQDPSEIINASGIFKQVEKVSRQFSVEMRRDDIIAAWKSHDTLFRQAADKFDAIIEDISHALSEERYTVPYATNVWFAQLI